MGIRSDESRTKFYDAHARTNLTSSYVYKQNVINKEIGGKRTNSVFLQQ